MKTYKSYSQNMDSASRHSHRGGALVTVMLIVTIMTVVVGSFFALNMSNSRVNHRTRLLNEARTAAQAIAEVALAEADRRAQSFSTLSTNFLSGYTPSSTDLNFLTAAGSHIDPLSLEVKVGDLSELSGNVNLVADDPMYNGDLSAGATLKVRNGFIHSKASAVDPSNGSVIPYYFRQQIQVREQSWIDYGVFYNMDLEFHAGPLMTVKGPVHTNANAYVVAGNDGLEFYDKVSATGRLFRQLKYYNAYTTSHSGSVKAAKTPNPTAASLVGWPHTQDATVSGWANYAGTRWNYIVRDGSFPASYRPPAFTPKDLPSYVPEDFSSGMASTVELRNRAYAMIEPQLALNAGSKALPVGISWDHGPEELKFSALSGFIIRYAPPNPPAQPLPWRIVRYKTPTATSPVDKVNLPTRDVNGLPNEDELDPNDSDMSAELRAQLMRAIRYVDYRDLSGNVASLTGRPWDTVNGNTPNLSVLRPPPSRRVGDTTPLSDDYPIYDRRQGYKYPGGSAGMDNDGFRGAFNCFIIDLKELNILINLPDKYWEIPSTRISGPIKYHYRPDWHWSNIVYVQTPMGAASAARFATDGDKIRPAVVPDAATKGTAVVITNGKNLPNLYGSRFDPAKRTPGFTLASNAPVYIHGHFNADGDLATGSSSAADPSKTNLIPYTVSLAGATPSVDVELPEFEEQSALIAGDSVTVLSPNFNFRTSAAIQGAASTTEVSAAIMTGLVPTQPGSDFIMSGGVHNLIRYLENWGSITYRYRGSMIALYESEVAKQPWRQDVDSASYFNYWYKPPTRDVGYHAFFVQGRIPPGVPIVRTLRRMNMERIDKAEYDAAVPTPPKVL